MRDLAFFSFEHYPYDGCLSTWDRLYEEPQLVANIMRTWYNDGVPATMPMLITESNLSPRATETMMDMFGGLWLADYIGSFLDVGGNGVYYFHYLPLKMEEGCDGSQGTFGMFTVNADYAIEQPLSQYFASRMINYEWLQHDGGSHTMFPSTGTYNDGAGHILVTSYTVQRPDGTWSVMLVNRDQHNAHRVAIVFKNSASQDRKLFLRDRRCRILWTRAIQVASRGADRRSVAFSVGTEKSIAAIQAWICGARWTDQRIRAAGR